MFRNALVIAFVALISIFIVTSAGAQEAQDLPCFIDENSEFVPIVTSTNVDFIFEFSCQNDDTRWYARFNGERLSLSEQLGAEVLNEEVKFNHAGLGYGFYTHFENIIWEGEAERIHSWTGLYIIVENGNVWLRIKGEFFLMDSGENIVDAAILIQDKIDGINHYAVGVVRKDGTVVYLPISYRTERSAY